MPAPFIRNGRSLELLGTWGKNSSSVLAGLGPEKRAELVRLLWPTGVPQDEINLSAKKTHTIAELDRRGSSCPVLFAWNGPRI